MAKVGVQRSIKQEYQELVTLFLVSLNTSTMPQDDKLSISGCRGQVDIFGFGALFSGLMRCFRVLCVIFGTYFRGNVTHCGLVFFIMNIQRKRGFLQINRDEHFVVVNKIHTEKKMSFYLVSKQCIHFKLYACLSSIGIVGNIGDYGPKLNVTQ